jgi:ornithine decarboxylase
MEINNEETVFNIDMSDKLQIVDSNEKKPLVHTMSSTSDIYEIISYFLRINNGDEPFYIVDLTEAQCKYQQFVKCLPRVQPFYAIKSNPDPMILEVLSRMGSGFDCASKDEIIMAKATGIPVEKILYANPTKDISSLQFARSQDVDLVTFDSVSELDKIKVFHPDAQCIIRIKVEDSGSECQFSSKFGCGTDEAGDLLKIAKIHDLNIVGISWHVGSNCKVQGQYDKAFRDARNVYDMAKELGFNMNIIDMGGGYPGTDNPSGGITFEMLADEINLAIDKYFGNIPNMRFIAEPGRFMCTSSHTLVTTVIGIKYNTDQETKEKEYKYTLSESVYASFNCIIFDHAKPIILPFNERGERTVKSTLFGRSCDSIDCITREAYLPKLAIGDKLFVENFGAYTRSSSSHSFNGFKPAHIYYIIRT